MAKYKVTFDRKACIGAFACVSEAPAFYREAADGKVDLVDGKREGELETKVVEEGPELERHLAAEKVCPVVAIRVEKLDEE